MSNDDKPKQDNEVDDLLSALDDWDAAFDSLHQDAETAASLEVAKEVAHEEAAQIAAAPALFRGDESDFGELNFDGEPKALGEMLGPAPLPLPGEALGAAPATEGEPAPAIEDEEVFTSAPRPDAIKPPVLSAGPTDDELFGDLPDEVDVRTIAPVARGGGEATRVADPDAALLAAIEAGEGDGGGSPDATRVASPEGALLELAAREVRHDHDEGTGDGRAPAPRAPALVRREDLERKRASSASDEASDYGSDFGDAVGGGGESTRVADLAQVGELLAEQARADAAAKAFFSDEGPSIALELDEDFYADIEIGGPSVEEPALATGTAGAELPDDTGGPQRRTAHIVRRAPAPTSPVVALEPAPVGDGGVVFEIEAEDDEDYAAAPPAAAQPSVVGEFGVDDASEPGVPAPAPEVAASAEVEELPPSKAAAPSPRATLDIELGTFAPPPDMADAESPFEVASFDLDVELGLAGTPTTAAEAPAAGVDLELGAAGGTSDILGSDAAAAAATSPLARALVPARTSPPMIGGVSRPVAPVAEAPVAEAPVAEAPVAEDIALDESVLEAPVAEAPVAEDIALDESVLEAPGAAELVLEEPVSEELVLDEAAVAAPVAEELVSDEAPIPVPVIEAPRVADLLAEVAEVEAARLAAPVVRAPAIELEAAELARAEQLGDRELDVVDVTPEVPASSFADSLGDFALDPSQLPESLAAVESIDEDLARLLLVFERELETVDDVGGAASLRIEAGRLCERLEDPDRAVFHYEAALLADPSRRAARRGLRRALRQMGRFEESVAYAVADASSMSEAETVAFAKHHLDLLLAANEFDLARVEVGERLDENPGDTHALLAEVSLSFGDDRGAELDNALARLIHAAGDAALRAALTMLRTRLADKRGDHDEAKACVAEVSLASEQALSRHLWERAHGLGGAFGATLSERLPTLASGIAARALIAGSATDSPPGEVPSPVLAWTLWRRASTPSGELAALEALAGSAPEPVVVGWALGEAAHLAATCAPERVASLLGAALEAQPEDLYLRWRVARQALEHGDQTAGYDALLAVTPDDVRARVRRANLAAVTGGDIAAGLEILDPAPSTSSVIVALDRTAYAFATGDESRAIEVLGAAGSAGLLDGGLARVAVARAAEAQLQQLAPGDDEAAVLVARALDAWQRVLELDPDSAEAHTACLRLATLMGDDSVLEDVLERMQRAVPSPTRAVGLALRRARLAAGGENPDLSRAEELVRDAGGLAPDDPRVTATLAGILAREGRWTEYAAALDERAARVGEGEAFSLRYRAGALLLAHGDELDRAAELLTSALAVVPGFVMADELLQSARRMHGDPVAVPNASARLAPDKLKAQGADGFARLVRAAEAAFVAGDAGAAVDEYRRALSLRANDPLARGGFVRAAEAAGDAALIAATALDDLRSAEEQGDLERKADAYELLAHVDGQLRNDESSATMARESALAASPGRRSLARKLWRTYVREGREDDQVSIALRLLEQTNGSRDAISWAHALARLETVRSNEAEAIAAYTKVVEQDGGDRLALVHLERLARASGELERAATLSLTIAEYFSPARGGDPRAAAAFMTRAGELLTDLGRTDDALAQFRIAAGEPYGYRPAMVAWQHTSLAAQLWLDAAAAIETEAAIVGADSERISLHHLAGVIYMDRALDGERAVPCLRRVLALDPAHVDAFVRLRMLFEEQGDHEDLAQLLAQRLGVERELGAKLELLRALAEQHRNFLDDREEAKRNLRELLALWPGDRVAISSLSDICWEQGAWGEAAEALISWARLEQAPEILKAIYYRLGTVYAERLPNPAWAIKSFERVLSIDPADEGALRHLAELGVATKEWNLALGATDRLLKVESSPDAKVTHLHRMATIFREGFGDRGRAERAIRTALETSPTNPVALDALVGALRESGDLRALRIELDKVCQAMRSIIADAPTTEQPYHVIARAMTAREAAGAPGSISVARCAAELAIFAGSTDESDRQLAASASARVGITGLSRTEVDDLMFPRVVSAELRQLFTLLGDRMGKHVGIDLRAYGVGRGERRKGSGDLAVSIANEIGAELGFESVELYVSSAKTGIVVAEPTSPVSLVIGSRFATDQAAPALRFATAKALKLAQVGLAIPARMKPDAFGTMLIGLLRQFQTDLEPVGLDAEEVAAQQQKLRRLIPTQLIGELRPFALAVIGANHDHRTIWNSIQAAGNRAGLLAGGSVAAGMAVAAGDRVGIGLAAAAADPVLADLLKFSVSADHARLRELLR